MAKPKTLLNKETFKIRIKEAHDVGFFSDSEFKFMLHILEQYETMSLNSKRYINIRKHLTKGQYFNDSAIDRIADKEV